MSSIIENVNRVGNFTSSCISKLTKSGKGLHGFGAAAITYIEEVNLERKLGRSVEVEAYSRDMAWGSFLETRVEKMLGFGYNIVSQETSLHPEIEYWAGSTDFIIPAKLIAELKCYKPKNFAAYTDALLTNDINIIRDECPEEYYQAISNAIINGVPEAELISYMPYQSELDEIREAAEDYDGADQWKYRFIAESPDSALSYLPDDGYYKNLNIFHFTVPQEDIDMLTEKVIKAGQMLIERK